MWTEKRLLSPLLILVLVLIDASGVSAQSRPTTTPTAAILVEQVQDWAPGDFASDAAVKSFDVAIALADGAKRGPRLRLAQREPGQRMLYVEGPTGAPIALLVNDQMLVYNGLRGRVIRATGANGKLNFCCDEGNKVKSEFGMGVDSKEETVPGVAARIDFSSIARGLSNRTADVAEGGRVVLRGETNGGAIASLTFESVSHQLLALDVAKPGEPPEFVVERFRIDKPVDEALFVLPSRDEFAAANIQVSDVPGELGVRDIAEFMAAFGEAFVYAAAATDPGARQQLEKLAGPIDWDKRRREDQWLVPAIRRLMGGRYVNGNAPLGTDAATSPASPPRGG
jgi:hypothetical protein